MGFSSQERFNSNEVEKWKKTVEKYNAAEKYNPSNAPVVELDPKKDKTPGPAAYSLINGWEGKKFTSKKLAKDPKFPSIFKHLSTGPKIGIYHSPSKH